MNILLIQEHGRHEANREFREALSMQRALAKLGHSADVWGLGYQHWSMVAERNYQLESKAKTADAIVLLEQYDQTGWVPDFSRFKGPRVFWTVDSHCNLSEHQAQVKRQKITHLLSSTARYLGAYEAPHKYWFPNCYDDTLVGPRDIPKQYDVGFCGNVCNRGAWINFLESLGNSDIGQLISFKKDIFVIGEAMVQAVNSYRIHFNRNIADDLNYRSFETTGCRTCLLTNYTPGLEELFDIGNDLICYQNPEHLAQLIRHLLNNPEHLQAIAAAGHQRAKRDHTYTARARRLVEILNAN